MTAITRKRNVPGYVDELGRFRPIRSASYIGSKSAPRKARVADRKKYSKAKAGDLGKARQARALEDPWDRDARLEREAKAAQQRERERIERDLEREIYGETSGRTSRGKGRSLAQFVRAEGGINTKKTVRKGRTRYGDSLENFTRKGSGSTGLVTTTPGKGKSLDYMHQAAREAGYDVDSMDALLDALDNEIRSGKKTYSTHGSMTYNPRKTKNPNVAQTILQQLGGNKFTTMTGAKNLGTTGKDLSFRLPANFATGGINYVKITLNGRDLYDVEFGKLRGSKYTVVKIDKDVYNDMLRDLFTRRTGLDTSLGTMGRSNPKAKKNPDLLSMFANAAVGIASTLQINEMVKSRKRTPAPKKRGTTKAKAKKRTNPANHTKRFHEMSNVGKAKYVVNFHDGQKTHRDGSEFFDIKIFANKKLKDAFIKSLIAKGYARRNPTQPKVRAKGDLYVLTIGSGDDLISVYLHDGDKDGFSKRFKTMAAARAYATRNKVKLVDNPKQNGIIKRAWARSRAASEYRRELRLEAAAERSRKRRQKAEQAARSNPRRIKTNAKGIPFAGSNLRLVGFGTDRNGNGIVRLKYGVGAGFSIQTNGNMPDTHRLRGNALNELSGADMSAIHREAVHYIRNYGSAKQKAGLRVNNPPRRSASGKKAVTRSAKPYKFKQGDRVTATSGPHKGKTFTVHQGSHSLGKPVYTMTGLVTTRGVKSAWQFPERGLKFAASAKKPRAAASRKNPRSTARRRTFEMFQGRKVTTARPMVVSNHAPARLDQLGDLIELKIAGGPTLKFNGKTAKLCAAGGKLWIAGKRFAKPNPAAKANEINPIGEIDHVVYGTRKPHHGDHAYTHYIHKLGEESGRRPILCVDREGYPVIRGGNYKIEARGIVD